MMHATRKTRGIEKWSGPVSRRIEEAFREKRRQSIEMMLPPSDRIRDGLTVQDIAKAMGLNQALVARDL